MTYQRLTPKEFARDRTNPNHLSQLDKMGISLRPLPDGRKYSIALSLFFFVLNFSDEFQNSN